MAAAARKPRRAAGYRPAGRTFLRLLSAAWLLGLSACAALPPADPSRQARVTGSLSLEFPDGFLGLPARTVDSYLLLHFRNPVRGTRWLSSTRDGRFSFVTEGGQELLLVSYEYSLADLSFSCYLNDRIGISFRPEPGEVLDLGSIRIRYTEPRTSNRPTFARCSVREDHDSGRREPPFGPPLLQDTYWRYTRTVLR